MRDQDSARIKVVTPGWLTTVQDLGRCGFRQYGMPVSGAMDRRSLIIGNRIAGNRDQEAALEITLNGPVLLFENDAVIVVTGGDLSPRIDGVDMPLWTSVLVKAGSILSWGPRRAGGRCYLALSGGIDVPRVLGSRSTHLASQTGGVAGRVIKTGDVVMGGIPTLPIGKFVGRSLPKPLRPVYRNAVTLRIVSGPQRHSLSSRTLALLTTTHYQLSSQSDRMGYRLLGARLAVARMEHHISDGTVMGGLQVPENEQPILLMADCHTTGGYPMVAVVISADLHLAGQLLPGDTIQFRTTTLIDAQAFLVAQCKALDRALPASGAPSS